MDIKYVGRALRDCNWFGAGSGIVPRVRRLEFMDSF
jgi:hypothetical protein